MSKVWREKPTLKEFDDLVYPEKDTEYILDAGVVVNGVEMIWKTPKLLINFYL